MDRYCTVKHTLDFLYASSIHASALANLYPLATQHHIKLYTVQTTEIWDRHDLLVNNKMKITAVIIRPIDKICDNHLMWQFHVLCSGAISGYFTK